MGMSFIKLPRHRVFHHVPIYYDEEKERLEEKKKKVLGADYGADKSQSTTALRIKGQMHRQHENFAQVVYSERKKSQRRLLVIIMILCLIAYFLAKGYGEQFAEILF